MTKRQRRMKKRARRYPRRGFLAGAAAAGATAWQLLGHNAVWDGVKWVGRKVGGAECAPEPRVVVADPSCSPAINVGVVAIVAQAGSLSVVGG
jgi:hypothetical protein